MRTLSLRQCSGICDLVEEPGHMVSAETVHGPGDMATDHGIWGRQSSVCWPHPNISAPCICFHQADCGSVSPRDRKLLREVTLSEKALTDTQKIELNPQNFPPAADPKPQSTRRSGVLPQLTVVFPSTPQKEASTPARPRRKLPPVTHGVKLFLLSQK